MGKDFSPFSGVKVQTPVIENVHNPATPEEDAVVLAMSAAGAKQADVAEAVGRSPSWVAYRKKKMRDQIKQHRSTIIEDMEEDYTDIISLTLYRLRSWLTNDDFAIWVPPKDLANILKSVFPARQLMRKEPTDIPGVPGTEIKGRENIDRIAIAEEFNRNFIHLQRAAINAMSVDGDIEEGEFDECQTD
jgi:hypothetical protein